MSLPTAGDKFMPPAALQPGIFLEVPAPGVELGHWVELHLPPTTVARFCTGGDKLRTDHAESKVEQNARLVHMTSERWANRESVVSSGRSYAEVGADFFRAMGNGRTADGSMVRFTWCMSSDRNSIIFAPWEARLWEGRWIDTNLSKHTALCTGQRGWNICSAGEAVIFKPSSVDVLITASSVPAVVGEDNDDSLVLAINNDSGTFTPSLNDTDAVASVLREAIHGLRVATLDQRDWKLNCKLHAGITTEKLKHRFCREA